MKEVKKVFRDTVKTHLKALHLLLRGVRIIKDENFTIYTCTIIKSSTYVLIQGLKDIVEAAEKKAPQK